MSLDTHQQIASPPDADAPLIFTFHGTRGDKQQFTGLVGQSLADAEIIVPRGDISDNGANHFFRRTGESVDDRDDLAARTNRMTAFIRARRREHAAAPICGLGSSNGANIPASVVFDAPDLFDRVELMHPPIPVDTGAKSGVARARRADRRRSPRPDLPSAADQSAGALSGGPRRAGRSSPA